MNKKHLIQFLYDSPAVRNRLGSRIFPAVARQGEQLPYLAMKQLGTERHYDLAGEDGLASVVLQLSVCAITDSDAREISEIVRNRLSGYRGLMESTFVHGCTIENQREQQLKPSTGGEQWLHVHNTDYRLTFNQTIPAFT
jgi:Protein of unknown function (DUF3168)